MDKYIPYARQLVEDDDIQAVCKALRSDWLTTGPMVEQFELALCNFCKSKYAVAVSSGTAALHLAMASIGLGPGDEVIVPAITFVATANAVVFTGARPVFADVCEEDLLLNPSHVESLITKRTKAIVAVDYAGQPCRYDSLRSIAKKYGLILIADACHSLGAKYKNRPVGSLADITVFSFHPVKQITTGEGGAILSNNREFIEKARRLRNHGIDLDFRQRSKNAIWEYDMIDLGFNYRITDFQCALGLNQLSKLPKWIEKKKKYVTKYKKCLCKFSCIEFLTVHSYALSAYHLFVIKLPNMSNRKQFFLSMRKQGIGVNVHYKPVYSHSFYKRIGYNNIKCNVAEQNYKRIVSLPIYSSLDNRNFEKIIAAIQISLTGIGLN